ncbi:MAG: tRNA uridine-5-carboxymethylaminomethyl(34) synthesis enzyme MnmG [Acholeplasmatales bacterium]|jgi:tRNA uridine 5-carboxymethylaminomethyl modification enzyme|nr:tRNA uridine-5-carboxymethylaminomethyl(34) synthesis enzyme MnmG [Acholeplasmatales bacterium]
MNYQAIIVGAGHAGCEAALCLSKRNIQTLLITLDLNKIATLPCNPSIGGPAKGIIVREIDALGGVMGILADKTQIQMKMLNSGKGYAVQALRAQIDKLEYSKQMKNLLFQSNNLTIMEGSVEKLIIVDNLINGVVLTDGSKYNADYVLLTTGTYLNSRCLIGDEISISGPSGEKTTFGLSMQLKELGFEVIRLKTGTPPRITISSVNFNDLTYQFGDDEFYSFSNYQDVTDYKITIPCGITRTTTLTKKIILNNLEKSALFGGIIKGIGPRYCPSIEDKIVRFASHDTHQIFLELESLDLNTLYLQGFSTSMPRDIQDKMVKSIVGLEYAKIDKFAYAIEYDAINPLEIYSTLETKKIKNLFLAGQINGTSGYEEAACQGLMAAINIGNKIYNLDPFILRRDEAYIGVLIDDLINKGTNEPYRMLTSRAEYRLILRNDNADERLSKYGYKYGLVSLDDYKLIVKKYQFIDETIDKCQKNKINPNNIFNNWLTSINSAELFSPTNYFDLIKRPEIDVKEVKGGLLPDLDVKTIKDIIIRIKYDGYIKKEFEVALEQKKYENFVIPLSLNYNDVDNLSLEAKEKLNKIKPNSIGQAGRILGINPSDINVLLYFLRGRK